QQPLLDHREEVVARLVVDLLVVLVDALVEIDLRARDVEEARGLGGDQGARLLRRHDVVRRRRDADGDVAARAEGAERAQVGHGDGVAPAAAAVEPRGGAAPADQRAPTATPTPMQSSARTIAATIQIRGWPSSSARDAGGDDVGPG